MSIVGGIQTSELQSLIRKTVEDQIVAIEVKVDGLGDTLSAFVTKFNGLDNLVETKASTQSLLALQESVQESLKNLQVQEEQDFNSLQTSFKDFAASVQTSFDSLQAQQMKDFESLQTSCQTSQESVQESLKSLQAQEEQDVKSLQTSLKDFAVSVQASFDGLQAQQAKDFESLHTSCNTSIYTLSGELDRLKDEFSKESAKLSVVVSEMRTLSIAASEMRAAPTPKADKADRRKSEDPSRSFLDRINVCEAAAEERKLLGAVLDETHRSTSPKVREQPAFLEEHVEYITAEGNSLRAVEGSAAVHEVELNRDGITVSLQKAPSVVTAVDQKTGITYTGVDSNGNGIPDALEDASYSRSGQLTRQSSDTSVTTFLAGLESARSTADGYLPFSSGIGVHGVTSTRLLSAVPSSESQQMRRSSSTPLVPSRGTPTISPLPVTRRISQQMSPPQFLGYGQPSPLAPQFNFLTNEGSGTYPPAANWPGHKFGSLMAARDKIRQHAFVNSLREDWMTTVSPRVALNKHPLQS